MGDKTDTASFLDALANLCIDYQAFRHIAKSVESERWAIHLRDYRKANGARTKQLFDGCRAALQKTSSTDPIPARLTEILENLMLA